MISSSNVMIFCNLVYYYWLKEFKVKYCPTSEILADFFKKPLQGSLFVKKLDLIMNSVIDPDKRCNQDHRSVLEKKDLSVCIMGEMAESQQIQKAFVNYTQK